MNLDDVKTLVEWKLYGCRVPKSYDELIFVGPLSLTVVPAGTGNSDRR